MSEQGIASETERAGTFQSGATPLEECVLPMHIPRQPAIPQMSKEQVKAAMWSLSELLGQEKLIVSISNPGTGEAPIWHFEHTFNNVLDMHFRKMSSLFRLLSWDLKFRIQFRSNWQQVGQALVVQHNIPQQALQYILPGRYDGDFGSKRLYGSYKLMTMLPHTKVPLGEDVDVHVNMDWNLPVTAAINTKAAYAYTTTADPVAWDDYSMGTVFVTVPWIMELAAGVNPNFSCRIWSHLTNVTFGAYDIHDDLL